MYEIESIFLNHPVYLKNEELDSLPPPKTKLTHIIQR